MKEGSASTQSANTRQVGGAHYKAKIQHWDLVAYNNLGYFPAQITRYVTRWNKKNGVEDVEKAFHYWQKWKELVYEGVISFPLSIPTLSKFNEFLEENALTSLELKIFETAMTVSFLSDLKYLGELLEELLNKARQNGQDPKLSVPNGETPNP